ncbi:HAD family hydrolase [Desulfonatronospira sp.]|uniref:D-glycero-alpha-D-manno-heptose-1,7-bisphosphate 7-phosphatase n=1 Tax=Desulfonatronospira sp. TaxID=1962951 RepID=UPI0025BFF6A6|nr:HAD family hydrolase [Desulfonatronospira sp.]
MDIKNIFLDRDGTIIEDRHYLCHPREIRFLPGAVLAMQTMTQAGCRLFVVTNQSGIGRGYFSLTDYQRVHERLLELLAVRGVQIQDSAFCPHAPEKGCSCRKPGTGMWEKLCARHGLLARESVMLGDKKDDILFGQACGFRASMLLCTGKGRKTLAQLGLEPTLSQWSEPCSRALPGIPAAVARDLPAAWSWLQQRYANASLGHACNSAGEP